MNIDDGLVRTVDRLPSLLEAASKRELCYSDFLEELLHAELAGKQECHTAMRIARPTRDAPAPRWPA